MKGLSYWREIVKVIIAPKDTGGFGEYNTVDKVVNESNIHQPCVRCLFIY